MFSSWFLNVIILDVRFVSIYSLAKLDNLYANVHGRGALLAHDGIHHIGRCAGERASDGVVVVIRSYDGVA